MIGNRVAFVHGKGQVSRHSDRSHSCDIGARRHDLDPMPDPVIDPMLDLIARALLSGVSRSPTLMKGPTLGET
jgi:hypothetical protein